MTTPTHPSLLRATALVKRYGDRCVLDRVGLEVGAGERVALTGPSGSGKSTLLNCLGGVDRPDEGQVWLAGEELGALTSESLAAVRRRKVGTIFQFFHLLPTLTVRENIGLPLQLLGRSPDECRQKVNTLLTRIGIAHRAEAFPSQLSGGEQQRVAIARALIHQPAVLLADEPTGNLDSANGEIVLALLRELTEETGTALVLVTHSEDAAAICHRTIHLRDGRIAVSTSDSR